VLLPAPMHDVLIIAVALSLSGEAMAQVQEAPAPAQQVREAASYYPELDELHRRRDEPEVPARIERLLTEASEAHPEDVGVLWRNARWHFWKADTAEAGRTKEKLSKAGWDLAERALGQQPESIDARYWAAANCGTYGETIGVVTALSKGIEGKFRKNLDYVVEKAPGYEWGGPLLTLGRYYAKLPWPKRDRKKAIQNLRAALEKNPTNLRARVYLAEVLLDDDEPRQALELVEEVLAAQPGRYDAPEERHAQRLARGLKTRIEEELK
jgi:tetratricopeptide (TPR) repeat protein